MTFLNLKLEKKIERVLKKTNVDESILNLKTSTGRDTVEQTTHVTPKGNNEATHATERERPARRTQRMYLYTMQQSSRVD